LPGIARNVDGAALGHQAPLDEARQFGHIFDEKDAPFRTSFLFGHNEAVMKYT
jgi:hypothetical protein